VRTWLTLRTALVFTALCACGSSSNGNNTGNDDGMTPGGDGTTDPGSGGPTGPSEPVGEQPEPTLVSSTVTSSGGKISLGKLTVDLPKNAVSEPTAITITRTDDTVDGYRLFSKVFRFDPLGLQLSSPIIVSIPFQDASADAKLFWSSQGDANVFEEVDGIILGDVFVAIVNHLGRGFVGELIPVVVVGDLPAVPTNVFAHAGDTEVDLSWSPANQATVYKVFFATASGGPYISLGTTTQLKLTHSQLPSTDPLNNGQPYFYIVRANNAFGDSDASMEASATPDEIEPPDTVTLTRGDEQLALSWSIPLHASSNSTYNVYRDDVLVASRPTNAYIDEDVVNGVTHEYYIRSVDPTNAESGDSSIAAGFSYRLPSSLTMAQTAPEDCVYQFAWTRPDETPTANAYYDFVLKFGGADSVAKGPVAATATSLTCTLGYDANAGADNALAVTMRTCYDVGIQGDGSDDNCSPDTDAVLLTGSVLSDAMTDTCQSDPFTMNCASP
jgi:hypothetical protein